MNDYFILGIILGMLVSYLYVALKPAVIDLFKNGPTRW